MKKILLMTFSALSLCGCVDSSTNPFFVSWDTPFGVPPFDDIRNEHFIPAFEQGILQKQQEITVLCTSTETPTFENTILAYSNSGAQLIRVSSVFYPFTSACATKDIERIQGTVTPLLTAHYSDVSLNPQLFERIKSVYDNRSKLNLDAQQLRLTKKIYKDFERSGSNLSLADKDKLRQLNLELSDLYLTFNKNLRADNSAFILTITDAKYLTGLPESVISAASSESSSRGYDGQWVFTLDKASMIPFLQYSDNRSLREQLYKGYLERCNNNNVNDTKTVIDSIVNLRLAKSQLLGYADFSSYVLENRIAKQSSDVYNLLEKLWTPGVKRATQELKEMQSIKGDQDFESWDWWYYAEKLRAKKYDLNENELRPYFALPNVFDGMLDLTTKLFGLTYKDITATTPTYHSDNKVIEVIDNDDTHLGIVYFDFHPREGKSVGAWCGSFRSQEYKDGELITPVVTIVCNFTKPVGDAPALLNLDEIRTLFHEYGHGLHNLFKDIKYKSLSGVERDFVELPSQLMENWAFEPSVLKMYATHYETGKVIPAALISKIQNSALFNQGFATVEYIGASLLDMDYHTQTKIQPINVLAFEQSSLNKYGLMQEIAPRYRSTYFKHIFGGEGYAAGYYSYIWAEVFDKDAYDAFVETGDIFNRDVAQRFRDEILSKGGTSNGAVLYENFRGRQPSLEPLKKSRGLL